MLLTCAVFHGSGGRIPVKDIQLSRINSVMQRTFSELGVKTRDVNGRNMYGTSAKKWKYRRKICQRNFFRRNLVFVGYLPGQATVRGGTRWGTYKGFIRRSIKRENLFVMTNAIAQKVCNIKFNLSILKVSLWPPPYPPTKKFFLLRIT